jgi:hypothetical protein
VAALILLSALGMLGIVVWGIVDAASRPQAAWHAAGQSKVLWILLQAVGLPFCLVGFILSIIYLAAIRPKVTTLHPGLAGDYPSSQLGAATYPIGFPPPPPPYTGSPD